MTVNVQKIVDAFNTVVGKERTKMMADLLYGNQDEVLVADSRAEGGVQENQFYVGANHFIDSVWQPHVDTKVAKGGLTFLPSRVLQRRHMVYLPFKPDRIRGSLIIGKLSEENKGINVREIVKILQERMMASIQNDRIESVIYKGVYAAPTDAQANSASSSVNGFGKLIELGLEAPRSDKENAINRWDNIGALDPDTIYTQIKELVAMTPAKFRNKQANFYLSDDMMLAYKENREATIGLRVNTNDTDLMRVPNTNWKFRPSIAMTGSNRCWMSPAGNLVRIYDQLNGEGSIEAFKKDVDMITLYAAWCESYGFDYNGLVWSNTFTSSSTDNEAETFVA
jgi:hypothetical protein